MITNDHFLKDYSNLASGALAATATVFDAILSDDKKPIDRKDIMKNLASFLKLLSHLNYEITNVRRYKIMNAYGEKAQRIMKKTEPTNLLFDGKLSKLVESQKVMEKSLKELQPKKIYTYSTGKILPATPLS